MGIELRMTLVQADLIQAFSQTPENNIDLAPRLLPLVGLNPSSFIPSTFSNSTMRVSQGIGVFICNEGCIFCGCSGIPGVKEVDQFEARLLKSIKLIFPKSEIASFLSSSSTSYFALEYFRQGEVKRFIQLDENNERFIRSGEPLEEEHEVKGVNVENYEDFLLLFTRRFFGKSVYDKMQENFGVNLYNLIKWPASLLWSSRLGSEYYLSEARKGFSRDMYI